MANDVTERPKPKNYVTGRKYKQPVEATALTTQGLIALGTVLAGAGVAVAGVTLALPEVAAVGMVAGVAGAALKYRDTIRERERLNK